jgi:3-oxoisoapionate decarboxylase
MIIGISSFTFGWAIDTNYAPPHLQINEESLLQYAAANDIHCLQIGDNLPLHTFTSERLQLLNDKAGKQNIRLEVGARKLTPEHLEKYIDIADFLNAPILRFVIDDKGYEPSVNEIIAIIKSVVPVLQQKNIVLGIENHDRFKARELEEIMLAVNSKHVGICLDCANSIGANEGLEWVTKVLAPYTVNLHVKDFSIARLPHKMGFTVQGAVAGKGMLHLDEVMNELKKYNRCQSAILELWPVPEPDASATVAKEKAWADESVQYLKKYFKS